MRFGFYEAHLVGIERRIFQVLFPKIHASFSTSAWPKLNKLPSSRRRSLMSFFEELPRPS